MSGQCFNNPEEAVEAYKCHISAVPLSERHKYFENCFFECKSTPILVKSILRSNKTYILDGEKLFLVLLPKNLCIRAFFH